MSHNLIVYRGSLSMVAILLLLIYDYSNSLGAETKTIDIFLDKTEPLVWKSSSTNFERWSKSSLLEFQKIRAGTEGNSVVWELTGSLVDHHTGRVISNVRGIEEVSCIGILERGANGTIMTKIEAGKPAIYGTRVDELLLSSDWTMCATFLSRKKFSYQDPEDNTKKLEVFRHTPTAPKRKVESDQQFSQLISFILNDGGRITVMSENERNGCVSAELPFGSGMKSIGRFFPRKVFNFSFFVNVDPLKKKKKKVNKWISVASPKQVSLGTKETYTYLSNGGSSVFATYSRHGECPSWYGLRKSSDLDLQAKKLPSREQLSPAHKDLLTEDFNQLPTTLEEFKECLQLSLSKKFSLKDVLGGLQKKMRGKKN